MPTKMPENSFELNHFRKIHFGKHEKFLSLETGELLLEQDKPNDRLFIIISGSMSGYVIDEVGRKTEVFRSGKDMFVGVRSFFSRDLCSYADVKANEKTELVYIEINELTTEEHQNLVIDFVPVLVNELYVRQRHATKVMQERESALKKLLNTEKMATLGQLAAGLTHELNNAVGVLKNSSEWLADEMEKYLAKRENFTLAGIFRHGMEKGYTVSSSDARKIKKDLEKKYNLSSLPAKNLAKTGINPKLIEKANGETPDEKAECVFHIWQLGVSLHDINLASRHSGHVIRSVKQLAVTNHDHKPLDINQSIEEALTLLRSVVRRVEVKTDFGTIPEIDANQGELVQVWLNIIKNGCESMLQSKTENPCLVIKTFLKRKKIYIEISDNGPGISQENIEKIFQPSFTTKKEGMSFGLGLGLSVVLRLVEGYNGKIDVTSKKEKTTFTIILPIN